ncbi:transglutaminase family protein [Roseibium sp. CAU 1637]|uniref:Transglutaminase family protein n=1 Tax=Roseibium limicola TaxID=2816037 RepID=A0A939ELW7_9HYPH|nr:transglutaminase family protein [Roseibium limicola]
MLYDISLTIKYDYAAPVHSGRQSLRLEPRSLPEVQTVLSRRLTLEPTANERSEFDDFFGNRRCDVSFTTPHSHLIYQVNSRVQRHPSGPTLDFSPPLARLPDELAAIRAMDGNQPLHFLSPSLRVPLDEIFTTYARKVVSPVMSAQQAIISVGQALHQDMTFDARATDVNTPVLDAFQRRKGVCQDFSHMMIACLRGIGIPAGYVSGYLRTKPPEGAERLEGADAMHAWVRAWCGREAGWIEYDPTNALIVEQDHIVVAYGRDYADVAPVKGVLRSAGGQTTSHAVDVVPL